MARTAKQKAKASAGRAKTTAARAKPMTKAPAKTASKAEKPAPAPKAEAANPGWATDLVFDVKEPKLAVSLRLDADVLRFFRGFGSGYQTRINEVLKSFMHARQRAGLAPATEASGRAAALTKAGRGRAK